MARSLTVQERGFAGEADYWRLRRFLVDLWPVSPPGRVWDVRRLDGSYFYGETPGLDEARAAATRLWRTDDGRVVAALLSEGDRVLYPHVHPDAAYLEGELLERGEALAAERGQDKALVFCFEYDLRRLRLLEARDYEPTDRWGVIRRLRPTVAGWPAPELADGYRLRTTRAQDDDHERLAALLNAAFGRDFHHAGETRGFQAHAPSFRRELDLVAVAPDGSFAAYAAVCWDAENRHGIFEPVCTHPAHRQRGLARALMIEGLRRSRVLGARVVDVETGDMDPANALYRSIRFDEEHRAWLWQRDLRGRG